MDRENGDDDFLVGSGVIREAVEVVVGEVWGWGGGGWGRVGAGGFGGMELWMNEGKFHESRRDMSSRA